MGKQHAVNWILVAVNPTQNARMVLIPAMASGNAGVIKLVVTGPIVKVGYLIVFYFQNKNELSQQMCVSLPWN